MKKILTAAAIAGVMALPASPAHAGQKSLQDASGDVALPQVDITSVKVRHQKKQTTIAVRFAHLPAQDPRDGLSVWIDTNNKKKAPNYLVAVAGFHSMFGSTSGWKLKPNGVDPYGDVACSPGYKYDSKNSRMLFRFKSKCIGNPKKIRVAVAAEHYEFADDASITASVRDHLVGKRKFTRWVKR
jgi:hypothetical protein